MGFEDRTEQGKRAAHVGLAEWWSRLFTTITTDPLDANFLDVETSRQTSLTSADLIDTGFKGDVMEYIMDACEMTREEAKEYINSGDAYAHGKIVPAMWGAAVKRFARNLGNLANLLQAVACCAAEYHALLMHLFDEKGRSAIMAASKTEGGMVHFGVEKDRYKNSGVVKLVARTARCDFIAAMGFKHEMSDDGGDIARQILNYTSIAALDGEPVSKMYVVFMG